MFLCFYGSKYYPGEGLGDLKSVQPTIEKAVDAVRRDMQENDLDLVCAWAQEWQFEYTPPNGGYCGLVWEWDAKTEIEGRPFKDL